MSPHYPDLEPISSTHAHLIALGFACTYVGSLYVFTQARLSFAKDAKGWGGNEGARRQRERLANERWRDDPDVIRARLVAVSLASLVCCASVFYILYRASGSKVRVSLAQTLCRGVWADKMSVVVGRCRVSDEGSPRPETRLLPSPSSRHTCPLPRTPLRSFSR